MKGAVILVGGFPEPVGGVTTFVRRLAASDDRVEEVVDLFFGREKRIPTSYLGRYRARDNKWRGFAYLFVKMMVWHDKYVHFNFSSLKSLMFFLFLPKNRNKWILMLHHGVLEGHFPGFLTERLLRRFDYIICMNELQYQSYRSRGVAKERIVRASSYVRSPQLMPDRHFREEVDAYFSRKPTFVASGYPTAAYNFDWCVRFVRTRQEYQLAMFLYGDGAEKAKLRELEGKFQNVKIYWGENEENFSYALSRAKCYLRPNSKDSFGIAVADAVNYGVPVVASDVCPRYQGAVTFGGTTYESFEIELTRVLRNEANVEWTASEPIVPFSYDLIACWLFAGEPEFW